MEPKELDQLLEKAQTAIKEVHTVDGKGRELLESLDQDIRALLGRSTDERHGPSIQKRLREVIAHFEVTHPTLTAVLSELSAILSNAGI